MKNVLAVTTLAAMIALVGCNNASEDAELDQPTTAANGGVMADDPTSTTGDTTGQMDPAMTGADAMPGTGMVAPTEEERSSLGVLNAINDHEIAAGNQALEKNVTGEVAAYARKMIDEHTTNREKTASMNPMATAAMATEQMKKGEADLEKLAAQDGDAYQKAYVDSMVKGHTDALAALDTKLMPSATTPEVATHLRETRGHVAQHLEEAKALQGGSN